ncbi:hypothetical protein OCUBac02_49720 (plasmid) [Bosea sp. ANAM02]|nr:hypothetical protein OCUBac02_49720 [Bosea sp. ANAM02]
MPVEERIHLGRDDLALFHEEADGGGGLSGHEPDPVMPGGRYSIPPKRGTYKDYGEAPARSIKE